MCDFLIFYIKKLVSFVLVPLIDRYRKLHSKPHVVPSIAPSCTIFEIFDIEEYCDLEIYILSIKPKPEHF